MLQRSWELAKMSWGVLREDRQLAVFPILSFIALMITVGTFALPVWLTRINGKVSPAGWILIALGYLVAAFVGIFANAALAYAANERLTNTGPGTVATGFEGARQRAGKILGWAVVSATVSILIQAAEQRTGLVGRFVVRLIGVAWAVATYMVIPLVVLEGIGPIDAVKRSAQLLKQTWGENIVGNAGIGLLSLGGILIAAAIGALGVASGSVPLAIVAVVIAVAIGATSIAITSALSGIYRVALYRYAVDGKGPAAFASFDFDEAFRRKGRRSRL